MTRKIKKVLVANRGEIAVRIFRTLEKMGIDTVAVFSALDADSYHVRSAGEALKLEGTSLAETYLNVGQIIQLAVQTGADAIHPGYGFLSESPVFAEEVRKAGLVFIGPGEEAIRLMGNKVEARVLVERLGVPVVFGATGKPDELHAQAVNMGFPVLVKAAAGGGGKGMRIVESEEELLDVLESTQREAFTYFGNGEVYLEKYLNNPKHIEVQLIADQQGNTVCLFERECSIQRRYQKIIEEAPSPSVSPLLRKQLMDAAHTIARNIGYVNAGTIEFLLAGDSFYFLEMNTRIQVEHPVTEMIVGVDIVREQLNIAMGMPLSIDQQSIHVNGHAIEARVYAEDPANDFRPSPGRISYYHEPVANGVRVDSAIDGAGIISSEFDPMISKVIVHAGSREQARRKMIKTLSEYAIHGIKTNISYLVDLLQSKEFVEGNTDTGFCKRFAREGASPISSDKSLLPVIAAFFLVGSSCSSTSVGKQASKRFAEDCRYRNLGLWHNMGYWRLMMNPRISIDNQVFVARILSKTGDEIVLDWQGEKVGFRRLRTEKNLIELESEGSGKTIHFSTDDAGNAWMQHMGVVRIVRFKDQINEDEIHTRSHHAGIGGNGSINAPMHGKVVKIHVREDDVVNKGDTLLILESMKMENRILAPGRARVQQISVEAGAIVASNASLVLLEDIVA